MFSRFGTSLLRQSTRRVPAAVRPTTGRRFLGGGGHGHGDHFHVSETHQKVATVMTTVCWVWILWRCYEDGAVVLGLKHPWDGHGGHGDHGHGGEAHFKEAGFDAPSELEEAAEEEHGY